MQLLDRPLYQESMLKIAVYRNNELPLTTLILLGIVAEIKKITHHQDQSMERLATRERGVHLHTLEDRDAEALQERG